KVRAGAVIERKAPPNVVTAEPSIGGTEQHRRAAEPARPRQRHEHEATFGRFAIERALFSAANDRSFLAFAFEDRARRRDSNRMQARRIVVAGRPIGECPSRSRVAARLAAVTREGHDAAGARAGERGHQRRLPGPRSPENAGAKARSTIA